MPTYSEEDLTTAVAAYYSSEYPSIRKCTYAFNILLTIMSNPRYPRSELRWLASVASHSHTWSHVSEQGEE
jgi:hypothetical protein